MLRPARQSGCAGVRIGDRGSGIGDRGPAVVCWERRAHSDRAQPEFSAARHSEQRFTARKTDYNSVPSTERIVKRTKASLRRRPRGRLNDVRSPVMIKLSVRVERRGPDRPFVGDWKPCPSCRDGMLVFTENYCGSSSRASSPIPAWVCDQCPNVMWLRGEHQRSAVRRTSRNLRAKHRAI